MAAVDAVVWDIGRVLVQWDFPRIWRDAIPDPVAHAAFTSTVADLASTALSFSGWKSS